ncbi:hypothetical protein B0H34DRAFT_444063 [Crassisporium funariophilum]|nr:hypothetical protein B0H34DRAFT_444063 [Crassisporium funariophilum]
MGGSAFSAVLKETAFPRLPPHVYRALKARLVPKIAELYSWVGVPLEAPEKADHGDLDLLVAVPKAQYATFTSISHEVVKEILGAKFMIPMDGNRTSNYAVPVRVGEWDALGHADEEERRRKDADDREIYYQVDIHVCTDKAEWDRIMFYHAYGDLGMILGLIARNNGLTFGSKGLKLPDPPNPPFDLSESFDEITKFLGLPMETYGAGFKTKQEVFEWVISSNIFRADQFRSQGAGFTKVKQERRMYFEFVEFVEHLRSTGGLPPSQPSETVREARQTMMRGKALDFFRKREEYEALAIVRSNRLKLKEFFSGSRIRDWTELGEYWKGVKMIMDEVRERLGGDEGVVGFLDKNGEAAFKVFVLQAQKDLGVFSSKRYTSQQEGPTNTAAATDLSTPANLGQESTNAIDGSDH